ncbi:MAG: serpin family protein, partial [Chloroflexi bacterium]|nr:serpin family protein [Chloroflexota bacterium]
MAFVLASLLLIGTAGCAKTVQADVVKSDKARITTPAVDKADQATAVEGNNSFAFAMYQALRQTSGNLFYSPYSISQALAMTFAGARGDTATSMAKALYFTLPQERLHPAFNSIDLELGRRGQGAKGKDQQPFKLHVANAIWGQRDFTFLAPFLDILAQHYGAGL